MILHSVVFLCFIFDFFIKFRLHCCTNVANENFKRCFARRVKHINCSIQYHNKNLITFKFIDTSGKGKGNVDLYSAYSRTPLQCSNLDHTTNNTISFFICKHSADGATTHICIANAWVQLTTHLSTPRGWMAELAMLADIQWTVYFGEVSRQLHVMTQAGKSSPVTDRRSNRVNDQNIY